MVVVSITEVLTILDQPIYMLIQRLIQARMVHIKVFQDYRLIIDRHQEYIQGILPDQHQGLIMLQVIQ